MANITILDPDSGKTRTISVVIGASPIIQNLSGKIDYYVILSTAAKDVSGNVISTQIIKGLYNGAGGITPTIMNATRDRNNVDLVGNMYENLTTAIDDYVAMMVEGFYDQPWTEMSFA